MPRMGRNERYHNAAIQVKGKTDNAARVCPPLPKSTYSFPDAARETFSPPLTMLQRASVFTPPIKSARHRFVHLATSGRPFTRVTQQRRNVVYARTPSAGTVAHLSGRLRR